MEEKVLKILKEMDEEIVEDVNKDLLATGLLDSFDIVNLVVELEEAFDIEIDIELITPENFQTVATIINFVKGIVGEQ